MKKIDKLISGLQIINLVEKNNTDTPFSSQNGYLFIGSINDFNNQEREALENLGFFENPEFECFEFSLD